MVDPVFLEKFTNEVVRQVTPKIGKTKFIIGFFVAVGVATVIGYKGKKWYEQRISMQKARIGQLVIDNSKLKKNLKRADFFGDF